MRTPEHDSILLLTSTLDASANWLVTRFLCDALGPGSPNDENGGAKNVVLVSWMRDYDFWRQESRKGAALDLGSLRAQRRFAFVDGLSSLFLSADHNEGAAHQRPQGRQTTPSATLAAREPPLLPGRGAPPVRTVPVFAQVAPPSSTSEPGLYAFSSCSLDHIDTTITAAIASLRSSATATNTLVILDNPDILLASVPGLKPADTTSLFLRLHTLKSVSHVLVHLQSDLALLAIPERPSPLQIAQQNLVVKTAHMSAKILSVRVLDTGVARDVSGVLRATVNGDPWMDIATLGRDEQEGGAVQSLEEQGLEVLYKIHGDGSVKVFERGTA